jgi:hypothetical protein
MSTLLRGNEVSLRNLQASCCEIKDKRQSTFAKAMVDNESKKTQAKKVAGY